jgi:tight adherence protein C
VNELLTSPWLFYGAISIGASCLVLWLASLASSGNARLAERVRSLSSDEMLLPISDDVRKHLNHGFLRLYMPQFPMAQWFIPDDISSRTRLQGMLFRAGIYTPSGLAWFASFKMALTILPAAIALTLAIGGWLKFENALLIAGVGGMCGMLLPGMWLRWAVARRQRILRRSLPDFLDLLVACVEGGISMQASFAEVSRELSVAHPELTGEFDTVRREMELGRPADVALQNLADRTELEELRSFATFVQQSQRFGSTMADALRQLSDMLRVQREHRAEEAAQKAAVKILVPTLIFIFPTVFIVLAGPAAIQIHKSLTNARQATTIGEP